MLVKVTRRNLNVETGGVELWLSLTSAVAVSLQKGPLEKVCFGRRAKLESGLVEHWTRRSNAPRDFGLIPLLPPRPPVQFVLHLRPSLSLQFTRLFLFFSLSLSPEKVLGKVGGLDSDTLITEGIWARRRKELWKRKIEIKHNQALGISAFSTFSPEKEKVRLDEHLNSLQKFSRFSSLLSPTRLLELSWLWLTKNRQKAIDIVASFMMTKDFGPWGLSPSHCSNFHME